MKIYKLLIILNNIRDKDFIPQFIFKNLNKRGFVYWQGKRSNQTLLFANIVEW